MNKIILGLLTLTFSIQAHSDESITKTGSLWLDQDYKIEVSYPTELQDVKLTSYNTVYSPEEQDCNDFRPAQCWTNVEFELGTIQVRILLGDKELNRTTSKLVGSASITRGPIDVNLCELILPSKQTYSVYPLDVQKPIVFSVNNKKFTLNIYAENNILVNTLEHEIELPVEMRLRTLRGWSNLNGQTTNISTELHTSDEWNEIKSRPTIDWPEKY